MFCLQVLFSSSQLQVAELCVPDAHGGSGGGGAAGGGRSEQCVGEAAEHTQPLSGHTSAALQMNQAPSICYAFSFCDAGALIVCSESPFSIKHISLSNREMDSVSEVRNTMQQAQQ